MRIKPYIPILWTLVLNLVLLICRVIRQITLPNRKQKGNLLSSLFILFTGLAEQLISFGEAVSRLPRTVNRSFAGQKTLISLWTYSRKYLRPGMLAAAWILFILSSFEWTSPRQPATPATATPATATQQTTTQQSTASPTQAAFRSTIIAATNIQARATPPVSYTPEYYSPCLTSGQWNLARRCLPSRRWLRLCTLRI